MLTNKLLILLSTHDPMLAPMKLQYSNNKKQLLSACTSLKQLKQNKILPPAEISKYYYTAYDAYVSAYQRFWLCVSISLKTEWLYLKIPFIFSNLIHHSSQKHNPLTWSSAACTMKQDQDTQHIFF